MTAHYWCELAWLGGLRAAEGVVIAVDGDRISAVCAGVPVRPEGAVPLAGLTLPALANAHSHAFHPALRGRTHAGRGSFRTWRDLVYPVANRLDPANYCRPARAVFAEMTLAGIGVVGEFHYIHHRPADYNPGSSYTTSISFCIAMAVRDMGMTIDEAVAAVTVGGAVALGRTDVGRLTNGSPAHVTILDAPSRYHLAYRPLPPEVGGQAVNPAAIPVFDAVPLPSHARFVVVGAGVHGLSSAYHLAMYLKRTGKGSGSDVVLIDKQGPGAGATGLACGCVRNMWPFAVLWDDGGLRVRW